MFAKHHMPWPFFFCRTFCYRAGKEKLPGLAGGRGWRAWTIGRATDCNMEHNFCRWYSGPLAGIARPGFFQPPGFGPPRAGMMARAMPNIRELHAPCTNPTPQPNARHRLRFSLTCRAGCKTNRCGSLHWKVRCLDEMNAPGTQMGHS